MNIKTALISVTDKKGLTPFVQELRKMIPSLKVIASGGTAESLAEEKIPFTPLSDHTGFPECFGGRVKTLHPKIFGGILHRRGADDREAAQLGVEGIDLVICNLYDFETASRDPNTPLEKLIEKIDIGGSSLIRSACKNFAHVAVVVDPSDYPSVLEELKLHGGISLEKRKWLASKAINLSANYEAMLAEELSERFGGPPSRRLHLKRGAKLRYGENPDQQAWVYEFPGSCGIVQSKILSGKELSYNNYEDATVAYQAACALSSAHGVAIVKHGSLCGYSAGPDLLEVFQKAWEGDSKSAFGSVIAFTSPVTAALIPSLKGKFIEVLIAPAFDEEFLTWARDAKPNLRLLQVEAPPAGSLLYKSVSGGMLVQTKKEQITSSSHKVVTVRQPEPEQAGLIAFALLAVNYAKSNAIAIVREITPGFYQLLGVGSGQPNRVDSLQRLAFPKAIDNLLLEHAGQEGYDPKTDLGKCVLASDGFFPFDDSVRFAAKEGIQFCVQPGGSTNDKSVIEAADAANMCMIFTGQRYFTH